MGWGLAPALCQTLSFGILISSLFELVEMAEVKRKRKRINERAK